MTKLNSGSPELHQENNSFSSQSQIEESTDLRSKNTLNEVQEDNKKSQLGPSTPSSNPLKTNNSLSPSGEMKRLVEQDEGTIDVPSWEDKSLETYSQLSKGCYRTECDRTWVANNISKFVAYICLPPELAEGWIATTDDRRNALINSAGFKRRTILWIADSFWTLELLIWKIKHALGNR